MSFIWKNVTYLSWSIFPVPAPKPGSVAQLRPDSVPGQNPNWLSLQKGSRWREHDAFQQIPWSGR